MKQLTLLFTAILTVLLLTPAVHAADIRLSSSCTLADAIIAANRNRPEGGCPAGRGTDTITLTRDITLDSELPAITSDITIEGEGYTISGDHRYRIFYNDGGALTIKDLTMTKGRAEGDLIIHRKADGAFRITPAQPLGGAIVNADGELSIINSNFSDNLAEYSGGAIANGGELSISGSSFSGNSAESNSGAIHNWDELSIVDSTFSHNTVAFSGGAIANVGGKLSIVNSSFGSNSTNMISGAIYNEGELSIVNNTFSDNSADIWGGAIGNVEGELSIINSTFSGNSADTGGAILSGGELSMVNSIIAGRGSACRGGLKRNINNFIQDGSCSPAFTGDPMLGELVAPEDGSPTYFPLLAGSRAIDAADDGYCPETDQIGAARPQGAGCDIGAVEYVAP